ncbi:hypothetical protein HPB51_008869 [Rhipicephalus microplus]|uniref:Tick transposon n=1 Tax=Rhipicephalus microplus TaxID=6941 RepID=A0A9J6ERP6_RHIMP|nr:hypothetical protein HPB51_008869 [Rhipicephalus microplus]
MEETTKGLRICLFALQFAVVVAGASVLGLPDDFPPMGGICEAAPAMDPRLLETTCVNLSEHIERPLEYHRCAAATTTSSSSETILPIIQQYLFCGHGDDPFFVMFPCPEAVRERALHRRCLLLLGGDFETIPGPMTKSQEEKLNSVFDSVQRIEANNVSLLESVNQVSLLHATLKNDSESLTQRVGELEDKLQSMSTQHSSANGENISKMQAIIDQLQSKATGSDSWLGPTHEKEPSRIQNKIDDLENQSRRSNLLFYGVTDTDGSESWEAFERIVKELCSSHFGISVLSISRAHRLGRFSADKKRPIIAKIFNEKEVESILSKGFKLKNTALRVARDYSEAVRDKRRKLLQFSKSLKKDGDRIRLVFNKLFVNDDVYTWDPKSNSVKQLSRRNNT